MDTKNFKQALEVLEDAKSQVKEILTGDEASALLLRVNAGLNSGITALAHACGGVNTAFVNSLETKPITKFMGKAIERKDSNVSQEQLSIDEQEKQIFIDKVNNLYERISGLDSVEVLKIHTIPEDVLALRGVAKRAGVKEFDGELNVSFVDAIKDAIIEKEKIKKAQQDALNIGTDPIPPAKEEKAEQRITRINEAKSFDEVTALVEGEDRKTVLDAAEKKIADFE